MTTWDVLFKYDKDGSISSMSESSAFVSYKICAPKSLPTSKA
jgi:hypothetical protein